MSYLLDKKAKQKKILTGALIIFIFLVLFYFRTPILGGMSRGSHLIFRPVLLIGKNIGESFSGMRIFFASKNKLDAENKSLRAELASMNLRIANYDAIAIEDAKLKEILGRKKENENFVVGAILAKPNQSPYDTLIIDAGEREGIQAGQTVFADGDVPLGKVKEVFKKTSTVVLFSSPGEKTEVVIPGKDVFMQMVGRGGGNFEMALLRDFPLQKGDIVVLKGITPYIVATVNTIISDPRDSFQRVLLGSPVNVFELNFVSVQK